MTNEKFKSEINTLKKFFEIYCHDKHQYRIMHEGNYNIPYNDKYFKLNVTLCDECNSLLSRSIKNLQNCPHEIKPRCRKCPTPCYNKEDWKNVAKIMKYSGMKLGLTKAAKKIKKLFKINSD
jgi:predicted amidophosphoribosyltransferase